MTRDVTCLTPHSPSPSPSPSRIGRRELISGVCAVFAASLLPSLGCAQEATLPATPGAMDHAASHGMESPEVALIRNADGIVFPKSVSAGPNKVTMINNTDTQMHVFTMRIPDDVTVFKVPDNATVDNFMAAFAAMEDEAAHFPEGYEVVGGVGAMSPGVTAWIDLDLEAGIHLGACFLPTLEGEDAGTPHAFLGMITTFEVP